MTSVPLFEMEAVSRVYPARHGRPATTAVDDVNVTVGAGETVAIVGPSGAGKSTLVRLALGLERPDRGHVRFDGADLAGLGAAARRGLGRRLQAVFQDPYDALDPRRPVWWSVTEPLRIHGLTSTSELRSAAEKLLALVGLPASAGRRHPDALSGGERQRASVARAVSTGPDLIVFDEPVSAVDAAQKVDILAVIDRLRRGLGTASLVVTHELATVERLADRVLVMDGGRVVESGPPDRVFEHPRHPVTRALVETDRVARRRVATAGRH